MRHNPTARPSRSDLDNLLAVVVATFALCLAVACGLAAGFVLLGKAAWLALSVVLFLVWLDFVALRSCVRLCREGARP